MPGGNFSLRVLNSVTFLIIIFHAFLFNIRHYLPEAINIQRREGELNIVLLRVNNFNVK